ncbi:MAG: type VI secretion system tube protein Hcp [Bradyrhizobiaceae bacterium]|nr:type VI secretion system tube protein Hcp [Bradyrhizobiaceae bacterium]
MRRLVLLVALCVGLCSTSAFATDFFLKIDGVDGESSDQEHKGWIEVQSWSWGVSNTSTPQTGLPTGKRQHKPMTIVKQLDKSSPQLYLRCAQGQHIKEAKLEMRRMGATGQLETFAKVTFSDLSICSIRTAGGVDDDCDDRSDDVDMETVSFTYQKISWEWVGSGVMYEDDWETAE